MLVTFLTVVQLIVVIALVGVILVQKSEGGGLGIGGGNAGGLVSARGAADLLTRSTSILAAVFIGLCIALAVLASRSTAERPIDTSLARQPAQTAPAPTVPAPAAPTPAVPLAK